MDSQLWVLFGVFTVIGIAAFIVSLLKFSDPDADAEAADDGAREMAAANAVRMIDHTPPLKPKLEEKKLEHLMVYDTYAKESSSEEVGGGCAICLEEYADGERRATIDACRHRFHALCVDAWLREKSSCPLCRHDLV